MTNSFSSTCLDALSKPSLSVTTPENLSQILLEMNSKKLVLMCSWVVRGRTLDPTKKIKFEKNIYRHRRRWLAAAQRSSLNNNAFSSCRTIIITVTIIRPASLIVKDIYIFTVHTRNHSYAHWTNALCCKGWLNNPCQTVRSMTITASYLISKEKEKSVKFIFEVSAHTKILLTTFSDYIFQYIFQMFRVCDSHSVTVPFQAKEKKNERRRPGSHGSVTCIRYRPAIR